MKIQTSESPADQELRVMKHRSLQESRWAGWQCQWQCHWQRKGSPTSLHIVTGQNLHLHADSIRQWWWIAGRGDFSISKRNTRPKPNGSIPVPGVVFITQIADIQPRHFSSLLQLLRETKVGIDLQVKSPSLISLLLISLFLAMNFLGLQIKIGISYFRHTPEIRLSLCQSTVFVVSEQGGGKVILHTGSMLGYVQTRCPALSYEVDFLQQEKFWSL